MKNKPTEIEFKDSDRQYDFIFCDGVLTVDPLEYHVRIAELSEDRTKQLFETMKAYYEQN